MLAGQLAGEWGELQGRKTLTAKSWHSTICYFTILLTLVMLTRADLSTVYLNYWHLSSFVNSRIFLRSWLYFPWMSGFQDEHIYDSYKVNTGAQWSGFPWVIISVSSGNIYDPDSLTGHRLCFLCTRTLPITSEWLTAIVNCQIPWGNVGKVAFRVPSKNGNMLAGNKEKKKKKKLAFLQCIPVELLA